MSAGTPVSGIAARWRAARRLYPIYETLATQYDLGAPPFASLESLEERSEPQALEQLDRWFSEMDQRVQVHQFRLVLQSSGVLGSEEKLQTLIERHLWKQNRTPSDRDKLDFLLVQYFVVCAPPSFHDRDVTLAEVAEVLEPVLGEASTAVPEQLRPLEELIAAAQRCRGLRELQETRAIERGREIKNAAARAYYTPASLVTLTRFHYMMRRTFFRLTVMDVQAIERAVTELELRKVATVDCSLAEMSAKEPLANLRQLCRDWKKPSFSDYGTDFSLAKVMRLRIVVENAVIATAANAAPVTTSMGERIAALEQGLEKIAAELASLRELTQEVLVVMKAIRKSSEPPEPARSMEREPEPIAQTIVPQELSMEAAEPERIELSPPGEVAEVEDIALTCEEQPVGETASDPIAAISTVRDRARAGETLRSSGSHSIAVGSATLLLNADEANSFLEPPAGAAVWLQRSVAARVLLMEAYELQNRAAPNPQFPHLLQVAKDEANQMELALESGELDEECATAVASSLHQLRDVIQQTQR